MTKMRRTMEVSFGFNLHEFDRRSGLSAQSSGVLMRRRKNVGSELKLERGASKLGIHQHEP